MAPETLDVVVAWSAPRYPDRSGAAIQGGFALRLRPISNPTRSAPSMFEPVHGSPLILPICVANPIAAIGLLR